MGDLATACIRSLLIFINTVFLVSGLTLLGLALYVFFGEPIAKDRDVQFFLIFLIGFGVLVSIIALIGSCGVMFDSQVCLGMYVVVLTIFCLAEIAGVVFGFAYQKHALEFIRRKLISIEDNAPKNESGGLDYMGIFSYLYRQCRKGDLSCKRVAVNISMLQRSYMITLVINVASAAVGIISIFSSVSLWHTIRQKRNRY